MSNVVIGRWKKLGVSGPDTSQVFAIGDVHGRAQELDATLAAIRAIPRSKDLRRLVFLGDIIDRGPASLICIQLLALAAELSKCDEVLLLPGNHELMLLDGLDRPEIFLGDWLDNGGEAVIKEAEPNCKETKLKRLADIARSAVGDPFIEKIRNSATWHAEGDLIFVHAGVNPKEDLFTFLQKPRSMALDENHWAWIRSPFLNWTSGWNGKAIIHGHTPAVSRRSLWETYSRRADRMRFLKRLNLDAGAAAISQIGWAEFSTENYRLCLTVG